MPVSDELKYQRLVEVYAERQSALIFQLIQVLLALWIPFKWWGRPDMLNAWAAASAVHVDTATRRARLDARAFMLRQLQLMGVEPEDLPPLEHAYQRNETPHTEVYKRPARQVEWKLREAQRKAAERVVEETEDDLRRETEDLIESTKRLSDDVVDEWTVTPEMWEQFERELATIVNDDVQTVARDEFQRVMQATPKVIGYRRELHPERSKGGPCGLCFVASTRLYRVEELMEMHGDCRCTVSPVTADSDMSWVSDRRDESAINEMLDKIYREAGSTYAEDLKRVSVSVEMHSELGPRLKNVKHKSRSLADVNRSTDRMRFKPFKRAEPVDELAKWRAMQETSERCIEILRDAKERGTNLVDTTGGLMPPVEVDDLDEAIKYHERLVAKAIRNLA